LKDVKGLDLVDSKFKSSNLYITPSFGRDYPGY
jgi:hypothetical protein